MAIPHDFQQLSRRLKEVRGWASSVTDGNRCAMVLGQALRLKPDTAEASMFGKPFASDLARNQPFAKKFFVKAWDLTEKVLKTWGPATLRINGNDAATALSGRTGFLFLEDCWQTPTEKMNKRLFGVDVKSGDHVDLWNGKNLAIYPDRMDSMALLKTSRKVWYWECK